MRVTALLAVAGAVIGTLVATTLHFLTWRPAAPPELSLGNVDYLRTGAYSSHLSIHFDGAGQHPSWWPLLGVGLGAGLILGALIGGALALAGTRLVRG